MAFTTNFRKIAHAANEFCPSCNFDLHNGEDIVGHDGGDDHAFHLECLLGIIRRDPSSNLGCPKCDFVATHIDGKSISMIRKEMGIALPRIQSPTLTEILSVKHPDEWSPSGTLEQGIRSVLRENSPKIHECSPTEVILAAGAPREWGRFSSDESLMSRVKTLSETQRGTAVVAASQAGDDGRIIGILLRDGLIGSHAVASAAYFALQGDKINAFRRVLMNECQNVNFASIVNFAIQYKKMDFIHFLSIDPKFNEMSRGSAVKEALKMKAFDIARKFLEDGRISIVYAQPIYDLAKQNNQKDILALMIKTYPIKQ